MKKIILVIINFIFLWVLMAPVNKACCQVNCVLKPPLIHIDFGNGIVPVDPNISTPEGYQRVNDYCPQDGTYAIVPLTGDCFTGHWITLTQDHTENDNNGKMLLVNAAYKPGIFFYTKLKGLSPNTTYELAAWIVNVCRPGFDCTSNRPSLRFTIENSAGRELAKFSTGEIAPTGTANWLQYSAMFHTPAETGTLFLKVINKEEGGCGNDFAMDDITVRECVITKTIVKEEPKGSPVIKPSVPVTTPLTKTAPRVPTPLKRDIPVITKLPVNGAPSISGKVINANPAISVPQPILTRSNPVIKQIETDSADIAIDVYDNGTIDGDTVSIYHNNILIVSRAGLSEKPITFHFAVDAIHPHHEIIMVANNLGSIPPNTSLMIVTARDKRYEVFISSTEQKNARVVIDLKK